MKRRKAAVAGMAAFCLISLCAASWRAGGADRARFDPVALNVLKRNHDRTARLGSLSGTLVQTEGTRGRERVITEVRLLKPNFARLIEVRQERPSGGGPWRYAKERWWNSFLSDGVTLQRFDVPNKEPRLAVLSPSSAQTEPVQPRAENLPFFNPCLYGFFNPNGADKTAFAELDAGRESGVTFIRIDGRASVQGVSCDIVTYKRTWEPGPASFKDWLVSLVTLGRGGVKTKALTDETTLFIDGDGLIRRAVQTVKDAGSPLPHRFVSEWRNVRADPPLSPRDFRIGPAATMPKGATKP